MSDYVSVYIKNGFDRMIKVEYNSRVNSLVQHIDQNEHFIAARVNNEITSLSFPLVVNSTIEFIDRADSLGMEVYRRSLSFLLSKVVNSLFPERRLLIGHSLGPGYYFDLTGDTQVTSDEIKKIEKVMHEEVQADKPISREKIRYTDALEFFQNNGQVDKYNLIAGLNMNKLTVYRCDDFFEVFEGPMATRTGMLKYFSLIPYEPGFILQFPRKSEPTRVAAFSEQRKIFGVYQEYKEWGKTVEVDNVGALNRRIIDNNIDDFIHVIENLQARKIHSIAEEIFKRKDQVRLITIAGPSSSGKTTFSKRLSITLRSLGLHPFAISLDNYFVDRDKTPLGPDGSPNYETIDALNLELLNHNLQSLLQGQTASLPVYDFLSGKSIHNHTEARIESDQIIIIEGIHGLNEQLTYTIPTEQKYKIYVSALIQMNIDDSNRIPTTDFRLIRRMVRDHKYRGHSALHTLQMWNSVRHGEETWIFPFQNEADGYFNSALEFELAVLKPFVEPLLQQIKPYDLEYAKAARLQRFLQYFLPIPGKHVPPTSILREFIGGSYFHY
jgi:uridine kinase